MLFLPTVRHVKSRVTTETKGGRGRQSLLFTVCCRYLWSRESFVSLVGGCWLPIVYLPISRLHASLSFFFADSPRYLYSPSVSPSFLFVSRPSRLLHPLLHPRMVDGRGPLLGDQAALAEKGKHLLVLEASEHPRFIAAFPRAPIPSLISED